MFLIKDKLYIILGGYQKFLFSFTKGILLTKDIQAVVFCVCWKKCFCAKSSRDHTPCQVKTTHISKNKVSSWSKNLRWDSSFSCKRREYVKEVIIKSTPSRPEGKKFWSMMTYRILTTFVPFVANKCYILMFPAE